MNNKVLIYTCCDKKYADFIPIFCASLLSTNKNIDIEIGTSANRLSDQQEKALDRLRCLHNDATILIKYNFFKEVDGRAIIKDGTSVQYSTVRFITDPIIKDKYTYISDVDIVSLDQNFYQVHIEDMLNNNRSYSNIVRKNIPRLSGLHFCQSDVMYPIDLTKIDITGWDEVILLEVVSKKTQIDYNTSFRPVHGIHMSTNRPTVEGSPNTPGWFPKEWDYCEDHDNYKKKWNKFKLSEEFKCIADTISNSVLVSSQINKLEQYYRRQNFIWLFNFIKTLKSALRKCKTPIKTLFTS